MMTKNEVKKLNPYMKWGEHDIDDSARKRSSKTKFGSKVSYGFFPDISGDEPDRLGSYYFRKGFRYLFWEATYYWGMFDPKSFTIMTYTEGDVEEIKSPTLVIFKKELKNYVSWAKKKDILSYDAEKYIKRAF